MKNSKLKNILRYDEPLARHTTFGIGGPAKILAEPQDVEALKELIHYAAGRRMKVCVIGSGSNLLVRDRGYRGMVIKLRRGKFQKITVSGDVIASGAGAPLPKLIAAARRSSLGGLEGLTGIPGTVGGAVMMNAGYKSSIGDHVDCIRAMDMKGRIRTFVKDDLKFGYRRSNLEGYIILEAEFRLEKTKAGNIERDIKELSAHRKQTQPIGSRSAGCIFKNPQGENISAGRLIDLCGLKGRKVGGAVVSDKHANFIINSEFASSKDVLHLIKLVQRRVKKRMNVDLEMEVKVL